MAFYGEDLTAVHAEGFEALAEAAAATLLRLMPPSRPDLPLLDLGCGAGAVSRILADRGLATWGVDISPALIGLARARLPGAEFRCGALLDVALPAAGAAMPPALNVCLATRLR